MLIQQHVFRSISVGKAICWRVDALAVKRRHHTICIAPALRKWSRDSSELEIKSMQLYRVTILNPVRLENASSKSSWTTASPDTLSGWRGLTLDFFVKELFNWTVLNGVAASWVWSSKGDLRPLAVSFTVKETITKWKTNSDFWLARANTLHLSAGAGQEYTGLSELWTQF